MLGQHPSPGIALTGTYGVGNATNASMAFYLYGEDAEQRAASSEPKWRDWFNETFKNLECDPHLEQQQRLGTSGADHHSSTGIEHRPMSDG
jgi:hypothetical protein